MIESELQIEPRSKRLIRQRIYAFKEKVCMEFLGAVQLSIAIQIGRFKWERDGLTRSTEQPSLIVSGIFEKRR